MNLQILMLVLCIFCSACAPSWVLVNQNNQNYTVGQLSFQAPIGWVVNNEHNNSYMAMVKGKKVEYKVDRFILSRNGMDLDLISVTRFDLADSFPHIGQIADVTTLPAELAEKYLAEKQIQLELEDLHIIRNAPEIVANNKGFLLQYQTKHYEGLQYDILVYGFAAPSGFYTVVYQAPSLHYFKANLADFNRLLNSLVLS